MPSLGVWEKIEAKATERSTVQVKFIQKRMKYVYFVYVFHRVHCAVFPES